MGSIPAGNIHKGTRRAKKERQTYVSLFTYMSVFSFLYGDANDRGREAFEVQRLVRYYRAPARDEEDRRSSNWAWLERLTKIITAMQIYRQQQLYCFLL